MRNGIIHDVLRKIKVNSENLQNYKKLTVLMFDDMKISTTMECDTQKIK